MCARFAVKKRVIIIILRVITTSDTLHKKTIQPSELKILQFYCLEGVNVELLNIFLVVFHQDFTLITSLTFIFYVDFESQNGNSVPIGSWSERFIN